MTRFNIAMDEALNLIFRALQNGKGGEIFVPKLKAYKVGDMKDAIVEGLNSNIESEIISIRPGEKIHEFLINYDELRNTFENDNDYVIVDKQLQDSEFNKDNSLVRTTLIQPYSSDKVQLLTKNELKEILIKDKKI